VSTLTYALTDSRTMLRRTLRRMVRYPSMTVLVIGLPLVLMLLFVYVFGGTLGAGLGGVSGGREAYLNYLVPGILTITIAGVAQGTAISIAMDMAAGIIARFRTMAISRSSVLTGHVLGALIQNVFAVVIILAVALLIGFRPSAGPLGWLGVAGMVLLLGLAVTWLSVAMGLKAKSVETASNTPMILMLLPFLGSGFVPTASLPAGLRWFAEYQPFTPVTETLRALLAGAPVGHHAIEAVAWCVAIALGSYLWAVRLFNRFPRKARWLNTGPA
jgi:ABC-2 type transport system permease protein